MPTEKQIDDQFSDLDKYLRWLINAGLWETFYFQIRDGASDNIIREIKK